MGTRPDAIKMAPVIKEIKGHAEYLKSFVVVTAQHRKLLDQVLKVFSLTPDFDLNIMEEGQDLYYVTSEAINRLKPVLHDVKPDLVLVQGDTTTTFVGALASFYERLPVAHVEAGLRSHNKYNPYPEEMNRRFTDIISELCFAPTRIAKNNLINEGIIPSKIWVTGNTAIDALFMSLQMNYEFKDGKLKELIEWGKPIVLVTTHRRENFDTPLRNICLALIELKNIFKDIEIIYSVHPNPNVKKAVYGVLGNNSGIHLIEPPDYLCFCNLMVRAKLILTDSGGIQEEAPSLGKPVLVMREVTERVEGIEVGNAILVGTDTKCILREASLILTDKVKYEKMTKKSNPYGDGKASKRIINIILKFFDLPYQEISEFVK